MTAGGAAVVAEVPDVCRRVVVGRAAAQAPLRVRGVLELRRGPSRVIQAEDDAARTVARQVAHLWIVAVDDELRAVAELRHGPAPALGDELELAVAVELVAEEVAQAERTWADPTGDVGKRGLVDLEQAELGLPGREQRGSDSRDQVRSGAVVGEPHPTLEDLGDHRSRRRLAVGGRDEGRSQGEPRRQALDRLGREEREHLARHGRSTARSREP